MNAVELTKKLIRCPSVTPDDAGAQNIIAQLLEEHGFTVVWLNKEGVTNLYAYYGDKNPQLLLAGHTDVVPIGNESDWQYPPFSATEKENIIWGRGAADMKSGVACLITSAISAIKRNKNLNLAIVLTSDEEGDAYYGTKHVVKWMAENDIAPTWCLLGEPSSGKKFADTIRVGRRGSLTADIIIRGKQGHIAYPELADNPIDKAANIITAMRQKVWDEGYPDFPKTSCQFSNINSGVGATNVIPADAKIQCNFRFNPASSAEKLKKETEAVIQQFATEYSIDWKLSGDPFFASDKTFVEKIRDIIETELGYKPEPSTGGGTSDGRFIATLGTSVIELGVSNATIHQVNERIAIDEIKICERIYRKIIETLAI